MHLVDVTICTYNHQNYISKCIEGVLMQKTNFKFRVLIADDCSTDTSQDIIKRYSQDYPEIIFPFLRQKNLGSKENSKLLFGACTAKYIANCDGDDYWIDENKLQKQVDFLEANPDYSICAHRTLFLRQGKLEPDNGYDEDVTYTINDLASKNSVHSNTMVLRNVINPLPDSFSQSPIGDYYLVMLASRYGHTMVLKDAMAVYRVHSGGVFSSISEKKQLVDSITSLDIIIENFKDGNDNVKKSLVDQRLRYMTRLLGVLYKNEDYKAYYELLRSLIINYEQFWETFIEIDTIRNNRINKVKKTVLYKLYSNGLTGLKNFIKK